MLVASLCAEEEGICTVCRLVLVLFEGAGREVTKVCRGVMSPGTRRIVGVWAGDGLAATPGGWEDGVWGKGSCGKMPRPMLLGRRRRKGVVVGLGVTGRSGVSGSVRGCCKMSVQASSIIRIVR